VGSQDLQQARYDQLVRRVGGLYGGGSKVTEVLPEMFPVLELENTTPELIALSGWRTAWQSTERPAPVGMTSSSQLSNPAGSNVIAVVTQIICSGDVAFVFGAEIQTVSLGGVEVRGLFRDSRFGVPRNTALTVQSVDGGVVGGGLRLQVPAADQVFLKDDNGIVVLTPGARLSVGALNDGVRLTVNYFWRERAALDSEINFP